MEPLMGKIQHSAPEDIVEKKEWIAPAIDVHDIIEMTQSGEYGPDLMWDYNQGYS